MDTLSDWIPLLGAAAIGLLAIILIASERGTKFKRREVQNPGEPLVGTTGTTPSDASFANSSSYATEMADVTKRNRELAREIAALASKLETSQATVEMVQARLASLETQNGESGKTDQRHQADLDQLRDSLQPGNGLCADADRLRQQTETENFQLEAEIASRTERSELEAEIASLKVEGTAHNGIKAALETTRGQLNEMTRRHQELQNDNSRLRKESAELKRQLAARADDMHRLKAAQQSLHELQIKQDAVTNSTREFRRDFIRLRELLTPDPEPSWQLGSVAEIDVAQAAFEKDTKPI